MPRFANPDHKAVNYPTINLIADIWQFVKAYRLRLIGVSILRLSSDLVGLYPVYAFASIVTLLSQGVGQTHTPEIVRILELLVAAIAWQLIAVYISRTASNAIIERITLDVEVQSIKHLFGINISWHEKENSGNKLKRINNGVGGIAQVLRTWINSIIGIIVNFVGALLIVAKFNALTALIILFFIISYYLLSHILTKRAAEAAHAVNLQSEEIHGLEFQAISNIRTVKVMGMSGSLHAIIKTQTTELYRLIKRRVYRFQTRLSLLSLWGQIVRLGTLILIVFGVIQGRYELGFLVLFNGYFQVVRDLAASLSDISQDIIISRYSVSRLKEVLNEPITIDNDEGKQLFPEKWKQISIQNLTFSYGNTEILKDLSFNIKRGEKVGIIGMSGAGKSTLFKLLLKEYEDFSGSTSIDGVPIQTIQKSDYFQHVAVVLQDTEVFNFSLKENIIIANDAHRDNALLLDNSLAIAHVHDFVHKLPKGIDTVIGEKGVKLSGGEKQRLGIARAVFKQPEILLLDEATSHLDLESEEKIKDSLHQFFEHVTAIVIAHRLTTIKQMDKILVIEDGRLVEQGNFDTLYNKQGRFYELWEKQKL